MENNSRPTQCQRVLEYMKDFGSISQLDAFRDLAVFRLSARIYELKERGYKITTTRVKGKNRYGEIIHYDEYRLAKDSEVAS